ncbi:hypothetical protein QW060_27500 [Myroides ceti]|uniref:Uncharacterized protein n=1 Tax=Paenimyroides ceti TaxID=395087 RepID=A0ABT8D147_9FLAO|nr:hypothetical protein [Paenimyroides ceti]MDN3710539.1 hypothetical protein [Paenimyroides ceti]
MKKYAQEKGVMDEKWNMLTEIKKKAIYYLARQSFLAVKTDRQMKCMIWCILKILF